jgi:hypothetical protein
MSKTEDSMRWEEPEKSITKRIRMEESRNQKKEPRERRRERGGDAG